MQLTENLTALQMSLFASHLFIPFWSLFKLEEYPPESAIPRVHQVSDPHGMLGQSLPVENVLITSCWNLARVLAFN